MEIVENVFGQEQIDELRRYETAKEFMSVIMGRANFDPHKCTDYVLQLFG